MVEISQWLKAARKGDDDAFFQIMSVHKASLYRVAYAFLKNEGDALEAIQEVTYRAYKNIKKIREPKYFSTWITRIMINYCNDELNRKKLFVSNVEGFEKGITFPYDRRLEVEYAIQKLEPELQEIIVLKYFQDLTVEQIAEQLQRPKGTIKTWLHKALKSLRKELGNGGETHV